MEEQQEVKPGERFGRLRRRYEPKREEAEQILKESGLVIDSPELRRARAKIARRLLKEEERGETDELTGLLNRKSFERRVPEEAKRMIRIGYPTALMFLDINHLKVVNDKEGHDAGDELLRRVAQTLRGNTRATDLVFRYGGDEFCILLLATPLGGAQNVWEKLNTDFTQKGISISAGLTLLDPKNIPGSLKSADEAMYAAKSISKGEGINHLVIH